VDDPPPADERLFDFYWEKTQLGKLRGLSRKDVQDYYDFFSLIHRQTSPNTTSQPRHVASEDRMKALQSELEWRSTRDLQTRLGILTVIALIGIGVLQHCDNRENARANTEHPKTQTTPVPATSNSQPSP
jgi:hypothetical protein